MDDFNAIAIQASGLWQFDDSNQTDYPIIKTNLVSGQKDYPLTTDGSSNLILEILKVAILPSATATVYVPITPMDVQSEDKGYNMLSENTQTGVPYQYDKTSNGIFLDVPPSYNATGGLKAYINRETTYFTTADTTKKPGVPGLFHKYFFLKPAREYARRKTLASVARLDAEVMKLEGNEEQGAQGQIAMYFARRGKDTRPIMTNKKILYI